MLSCKGRLRVFYLPESVYYASYPDEGKQRVNKNNEFIKIVRSNEVELYG